MTHHHFEPTQQDQDGHRIVGELFEHWWATSGIQDILSNVTPAPGWRWGKHVDALTKRRFRAYMMGMGHHLGRIIDEDWRSLRSVD